MESKPTPVKLHNWLIIFLSLTTTFLNYLCPKTGSYKGGSTGGASPAAHSGPDTFIQLILRQDYMKRSLERTGQTWTQIQ